MYTKIVGLGSQIAEVHILVVLMFYVLRKCHYDISPAPVLVPHDDIAGLRSKENAQFM